MFIFVDTETTGLDRVSDFLLEVGLIATDDQLNEIDSFSIVTNPSLDSIARGQACRARLAANEFVRNMHTNSGLLGEVETHGCALDEAEARVLHWLDGLDIDVSTIPMAGSTIDFDRGVLSRNMPAVNDRFHYRSINVSTIKELVRVWQPHLAWPKSAEADKAHRVLADCRESIRELAYYKRNVFDATGTEI